MIDITGLREDKRPQSSIIVHALLDRLEAAEKERDALRAKIEAMEQQEPVAEMVDTDFEKQIKGINYWWRLESGTKLYTLPGAKGEDK